MTYPVFPPRKHGHRTLCMASIRPVVNTEKKLLRQHIFQIFQVGPCFKHSLLSLSISPRNKLTYLTYVSPEHGDKVRSYYLPNGIKQ